MATIWTGTGFTFTVAMVSSEETQIGKICTKTAATYSAALLLLLLMIVLGSQKISGN